MPTLREAIDRNIERRARIGKPIERGAPQAIEEFPAPRAGSVSSVPAASDPTIASRGSLPDMLLGASGRPVAGPPCRSRIVLPVTVGLSGAPQKSMASPATALAQSAPNAQTITLSAAEAASIGLTTSAQQSAFIQAVGAISGTRTKNTVK